MTTGVEKIVPREFVWRRIHSLMGVWISLFLVVHLITNSGAALWIGSDGNYFVRLSNFLEELPYLQVVEIVLLGIPLALHMVLGVKYLISGKPNSFNKEKGTKPAMRFGRSHAYSWQRITAPILLVGIILHVIQMRFMDSPHEVLVDNQAHYLVKLDFDTGLYSVADRLNVKLYNQEMIQTKEREFNEGRKVVQPLESEGMLKEAQSVPYNPYLAEDIHSALKREEKKNLLNALQRFDLKPDQVVASALSPGKVMLLNVRETFKSFWMIGFYTIFTLAAVYHGFNGLWTALITWGAILSYRSQKMMGKLALLAMLVVMFLGLASIWGSYWINLRN